MALVHHFFHDCDGWGLVKRSVDVAHASADLFLCTMFLNQHRCRNLPSVPTNRNTSIRAPSHLIP